MIDLALQVAMGMIAVAMLLSLFRLLRGPAAVDRVLAIDTLYINAIALLILFGMQLRSAIYFEAALVIAMLGFVSTIMLCKYLLRKDIVE